MLFRVSRQHWRNVSLWHVTESHDPKELYITLEYGKARRDAEPLRLELRMAPGEVRELCDSMSSWLQNSGA